MKLILNIEGIIEKNDDSSMSEKDRILFEDAIIEAAEKINCSASIVFGLEDIDKNGD